MRSFLSGILGAFVAVLLVGPQPQVIDQTRTVVQRVETPGRTIYVTQKVCDTSTVAKLINEVLRSRAASGKGHTDSGSAISGAGSVSQSGAARSGDVILGQVIDALAICGTVNVTAENTVTDSEGRSGDSTVENDANVKVGKNEPEPTDVDSGAETGPGLAGGRSSRDDQESSPGVTPSPTPL